MDFARAMVHAVAHNGQVARYANSAKGLDGRRRPGGEQMRNTASRTQAEDVYGCLAETVSHQLETLYDMGILKRHDSLDVAIDMHLIPRHDKKHGAELVRSRYKSGTCVFERYITTVHRGRVSADTGGNSHAGT